MTLHAFADESRRGDTYLMAMAVVDPSELAALRKAVRGLLFSGQRELHCKKESPSRRRLIASTLVDFPVRVWLYTRSCRDTAEVARQECLARMVDDLLAAGGQRLVLDTRENRDRQDEATIRAVLGGQPRWSGLTYEHLDGGQELVLGVPDTVAWCYGAGGDWRRRIAPAVADVIQVRPGLSRVVQAPAPGQRKARSSTVRT